MTYVVPLGSLWVAASGRTQQWFNQTVKKISPGKSSGPLQYVVSLATALASPQLVNRVLTDSRLESLEDPPAILRDARCIGGLSDEALEDPETLREAFIEWGTDLEDLTAKLSAGEYEDCNRFRCSIIRSAHSLAGSLVHLFDALGIDATRELRVPAGLNTNSRRRSAFQQQFSRNTVRSPATASCSKLEAILTPDRYGDPDDLLGSTLFWLPDLERLLEHPVVGPWMRLAAALSATEPLEDNRAVQMRSPLE